ncbi:MAG: hypothetical protein WC889_16900, partial [Myxococcota bacterium]
MPGQKGSTLMFAFLAALAVVISGCGGGGTVADAGSDTGVADTGVIDVGVPDAGVADTGVVTDTGVTDAGETDTGVADAGE